MPPELLVRVFGHLWNMAAAPLTDAVPSPVVGPWATTAADQENQTTPPLVTSRTWMATSAVAQVCRAFREAFLSSVEHLCVEVRGGEGEPGVVLPRWAALATTLRRLTSLRTLELRLCTLRPSWVLHLVANLLADTLGGGVQSLRALSLTSRGYLDMPLRQIVAGQTRLTHLSLTLEEPAPTDALHLSAVYKGMASRLQSLDLRALMPLTEAAATSLLQSLPTLGFVRAVHMNGKYWGSEAGLTALAATCPAVETLTVGELASELRSGAGAAAMLRLFPSLHTLAVGAPDEGSPGMSLPLLFVATMCAGRRFATLSLPGLVPGPDDSAAEPVQLAQALGNGNHTPERLRLNGPVEAPMVAGLHDAPLSTLTALHLSDVRMLDKDAAVGLASLSGLAALSLGGASASKPLVLKEEVLATLGPPNLRQLHPKHVELVGAAGAALVAAMARMSPQTLRHLSLTACIGEMSAAVYALVVVNSFQRLGLIDLRVQVLTYKPASRQNLYELVDAANSCQAAKAFAAAHRPDIAFY